METRPLVPWNARYRAALRRVIQTYTDPSDRKVAVGCFARAVEDLRLVGLEGSGLLVAAEHMAKSRLRHASIESHQPLEFAH